MIKLFSRSNPTPLFNFSLIEKPQPLPKNRKPVLPYDSPVSDLSEWQEGGWLKQEREPLQKTITDVYEKLK